MTIAGDSPRAPAVPDVDDLHFKEQSVVVERVRAELEPQAQSDEVASCFQWRPRGVEGDVGAGVVLG